MREESQPVTSTGARVLELDATRGAAMLAVVLSHSVAFLLPTHDSLGRMLTTIGFIATPTFLLLSGVICGHLRTRYSDGGVKFRSRLIDRGLFLLLIVHLLLGLTHAMWESPSIAICGSFYITDAVAVGLIVAALIGPASTRDRLLWVGAVLLLSAWFISVMAPASHEHLYRDLVRLIVGLEDSGDQDEGWIVPIVPYLGVFFIGLASGVEYTALRSRTVSREIVARYCIRIGLASASAGVALKIGWLVCKSHLPPSWHPLLYWLTDPRAKMPPGPVYVLAYGGAGLAMGGAIIRLADTRRGEPLVRWLAVMGRSSLFVFVAQYWLILVPASGFHVRGNVSFWALALVGSIACCWVLAWFWDRSDGNRLLTLRPLLGTSLFRLFAPSARKTRSPAGAAPSASPTLPARSAPRDRVSRSAPRA